jgi:hypothetical protein
VHRLGVAAPVDYVVYPNVLGLQKATFWTFERFLEQVPRLPVLLVNLRVVPAECMA